ncbi:MAG: hypothetical protein OXJ90_08100 [Spirochaetaceae bacterium]|nr:hypothetical protein [Spirochaetaceae bacterium]
MPLYDVSWGRAAFVAVGANAAIVHYSHMQLSLLALAVIPEPRISDLSLVDVSHFIHLPGDPNSACPHFGACRARRQHRTMLENRRDVRSAGASGGSA